MIPITPQFRQKYPDAFRIARRDRMRVVWLEEDLAYVSRRAKGHGRYLISFHVIETINREIEVRVECRHTTGQRCYKAQRDELCSHAAKVILRWEAKHTRREKKAA